MPLGFRYLRVLGTSKDNPKQQVNNGRGKLGHSLSVTGLWAKGLQYKLCEDFENEDCLCC